MEITFTDPSVPVIVTVPVTKDMEKVVQQRHFIHYATYEENLITALEEALHKRLAEEYIDREEYSVMTSYLDSHGITLKIQFLSKEAYSAAKMILT